MLDSIRLLSLFCVFGGLMTMASAHWQTENHEFQPPGEGDVRSPCPFLNTLANHGYVPRNGKNVTIRDVVNGGREGFNVGPNFLKVVGKKGYLTSPYIDSFDLNHLNLRGCIETDASLTRADAFFAPNDTNLVFNETVYQTLASSNPGVDYYNITSAGWVLQARLNDSLANNPELVNGPKEIFNRAGASALYLSVLGDPKAGTAPKKFVDTVFREERMPDIHGWRKSETIIDLDIVLPLAQAIQAASNWISTGGAYPGQQELVLFSG